RHELVVVSLMPTAHAVGRPLPAEHERPYCLAEHVAEPLHFVDHASRAEGELRLGGLSLQAEGMSFAERDDPFVVASCFALVAHDARDDEQAVSLAVVVDLGGRGSIRLEEKLVNAFVVCREAEGVEDHPAQAERDDLVFLRGVRGPEVSTRASDNDPLRARLAPVANDPVLLEAESNEAGRIEKEWVEPVRRQAGLAVPWLEPYEADAALTLVVVFSNKTLAEHRVETDPDVADEPRPKGHGRGDGDADTASAGDAWTAAVACDGVRGPLQGHQREEVMLRARAGDPPLLQGVIRTRGNGVDLVRSEQTPLRFFRIDDVFARWRLHERRLGQVRLDKVIGAEGRELKQDLLPGFGREGGARIADEVEPLDRHVDETRVDRMLLVCLRVAENLVESGSEAREDFREGHFGFDFSDPYRDASILYEVHGARVFHVSLPPGSAARSAGRRGRLLRWRRSRSSAWRTWSPATSAASGSDGLWSEP